MTLLDATGLLLSRAAHRAQKLTDAGQPAEEIVVVSVTDGHENASCELTLATVRRMIEDRTADGWTFVFLGAAADVYAEAGGLGYDQRSSQSFATSQAGTALAFDTLSSSTRSLRDKLRRLEQFDKGDFFEGDKPAETIAAATIPEDRRVHRAGARPSLADPQRDRTAGGREFLRR